MQFDNNTNYAINETYNGPHTISMTCDSGKSLSSSVSKTILISADNNKKQPQECKTNCGQKTLHGTNCHLRFKNNMHFCIICIYNVHKFTIMICIIDDIRIWGIVYENRANRDK